MKKLKIISILAMFLSIISCSTKNGEGFYKGYETPNYKVIEKVDNFEIRQYQKTLVAEVEVDGQRKDAVKEGFMTLARYIFGKNNSKQKLAMTSPVAQKEIEKDQIKSEKIAMTSPVNQVQKGDKKWLVQFNMPKEFTIQTLPEPQDKRIKFKIIPERKMVAIVFSGSWSDKKFSENTDKLNNFIKNKNIKTIGEATLAYYDDPFTFPWNRRNEVIWEIK